MDPTIEAHPRSRRGVALGILCVLGAALTANPAVASVPFPPSYEYAPRLTLRSAEIVSVDGEPVTGVEAPARLADALPEGPRMPSCRHPLAQAVAGEARLELAVDAQGAVNGIRPLDSRPAGAAELVAEVMDLWRFAPLKVGGAAVPFVATVTVDYRCGVRPTPEEIASPDGVERWSDQLRALTDGSVCGIVERALFFASRDFPYEQHVAAFTRLAEAADWRGWLGQHWLAFHDGSGTASLLPEMDKSDAPCIRCHALGERYRREEWPELALDDDLRRALAKLMGEPRRHVQRAAESSQYVYVESADRTVWAQFYDRADWSLLCEIEGYLMVSPTSCFTAADAPQRIGPFSAAPCDEP